MINPLTYCRILGMSIETISQQKTVRGMTQTLTGRQVVVRFRSVHAEVLFLYKGREVDRLSAWVGIDAAVSDAKRHAKEWKLTAQEDGEIAVRVTVTVESAALLEPTAHYLAASSENDDLSKAITRIPGHEPAIPETSIVWTTKESEAANHLRVAQMETSFASDGRPPHLCMVEAKTLFEKHRRLCA